MPAQPPTITPFSREPAVPGAINLTAGDLDMRDILRLDTAGAKSAQTTLGEIYDFFANVEGIFPAVVASVTALRALLVRYPLVTTQGWAAANDGGGGPPWSWDANSTAADDGFLTVKLAAYTVGRYVRMLPYGATASPKWGGAGLGASDDTARMLVVLSADGSHPVDISGCTIPTDSITISDAWTLPGIFGDLSGTLTNIPSTTHDQSLYNIYKSDFYLRGINFVGPISHVVGERPNLSTIVEFDTAAAESTNQTVTGCTFKGAHFACQFKSANQNAFCRFQDNIVTDTYGDATLCLFPKQCVFAFNFFYNCGVDPDFTDSVTHFSTHFGTGAFCESVVVHGNTYRFCNQGFTQEAIDMYGTRAKNMIFTSNVIDNVYNGFIEFKPQDDGNPPDIIYGDILVANNIVNFGPQGGIGIAMNDIGSAAGTVGRFKISGNQFLSDSAAGANPAVAINVGPYHDLSITDNFINNIQNGIQLNPAGTLSNTATNVVVSNNDINVWGLPLYAPARTFNRLTITGNNCVSTGSLAIQMNGATTNNGTISGNNFVSTFAGSAAAEFRDIQIGVIEGNTFSSDGSCVIFQGVASTNLRFVRNDIRSTGGHACAVDTGTATMVFLNNTADIGEGSRFIAGAAAGTVVKAGNVRGTSTTSPTGVFAGSVGDIFLNSSPAIGAYGAWICTTAGNAGAAIYTGTNFVGTPSGAQLSALISGVDFNSGNTDNAVAIPLPAGITRFIVREVWISGASHSLTAATCGLFTAAAGGGSAIVASGSAITVSATTENTGNNTQLFAINTGTNESFNAATLFFRVQTAEGVAATGNVTIVYVPLS